MAGSGSYSSKTTEDTSPATLALAKKLCRWRVVTLRSMMTTRPSPLQADAEQGAGLIEGELARHFAAGGEGLDQRQVARGVVDRVGQQRVRGDLGGVLGVEVGDLEGALAAGRDDEELGVGLFVC